MTAALGWGALAASSLVIGALLGLARKWPDRAVGIVLAFGAGALVSAVSFDLAEEGLKIGSGAAVGGGLAVGALTYFVLDRLVERRGSGDGAGPALALGAFLDGIPEQAVLGIGLAAGEGVSVEPAGGDLRLQPARGDRLGQRDARGRDQAGDDPAAVDRRRASCARWPRSPAMRSPTPPRATSRPAINGFAAGALLVMLIDSMIPEAAPQGRRRRGPRHRPRLRRRHRPLGRPPQLVALRARHRRAGRQAQRRSSKWWTMEPAALDEAIGRLAVGHLDLDELPTHLHAEAQAVPFGGQPRAEADVRAARSLRPQPAPIIP